MHYKLMFPNDYVSSADLNGSDQVVTIRAIQYEELKGEKGRTDNKYCVYFNETPKKLVLNKTNAKTIAKLHGNETNIWIGKQITLFPTTTKFGRDTVEAIRIRGNNKKTSALG